MNQKDYNVIAEIIKKINNFHCYDVEDKCLHAKEILMKELIYELSDYFERKEKKRFGFVSKERFDKKQFLKDCGAEQ